MANQSESTHTMTSPNDTHHDEPCNINDVKRAKEVLSGENTSPTTVAMVVQPNNCFDIIAVVDSKWGLAKDNKLPWEGAQAGREDMRWFKHKTRAEPDAHRGGLPAIVIMGRNTWGLMRKPLSKRINVVVSSHAATLSKGEHIPSWTPRFERGQQADAYSDTFESALQWSFAMIAAGKASRCFVCGGANIYKQALCSPYLRYAWITIIEGDYQCDIHFPHEYLDDGSMQPANVTGAMFYNAIVNTYNRYNFVNRAEGTYLKLLKDLLKAPMKPNRTGIRAHSTSHKLFTVTLYEPGRGTIIPLLTTKKIIWKSIYHELIWFLRGSSNTDYLNENNVRIWRANSSKQFLKTRGLGHYEEGELGPIYGWQWRQWGHPYTPQSYRQDTEIPIKDTQYDQLKDVIEMIKRSPWDRRMIVSAWNVSQLADMALPPCHYSFQFNVDPDEHGAPKWLNCMVNMRSTDTFCGLPFNIASYALLTHMVSLITGLTPGKLSISMCDVHLYENAIDQAKTQLQRVPKRFPCIRFSPKITAYTPPPTIDSFAHEFTMEDYIIEGYVCDPYIKVDMAV